MRTRPIYLADTNIFLFFAFAFLAITISMNVSSSRVSAAENEMRQKPTVNTDIWLQWLFCDRLPKNGDYIPEIQYRGITDFLRQYQILHCSSILENSVR